MPIKQYTIDHREYQSSRDTEISLKKNRLYSLPYLSVIRVDGDRASEFLQGQLSCDLREVNDTTMRPGILCNLKGRVLALLDVVKWRGFHLVLPADLITDTKNSLAKTALVSRVRLLDNPKLRVFGFYLEDAADVLPFNWKLPTQDFSLIADDKACVYAIGDHFYLLLVQHENVETLCEPFINNQQLYGSLEWHQEQLQRLHVEIYPKTRGLFLPHRINLHKKSYISFNKGCYKGQEIIARMHYRGKLKHTLQVFTLQTSETLEVGLRIFSNDDRHELGELVDFCPISHNHYCILASIIQDYPKEIIFEGHNRNTLANSS